jgi:TRAP-type C4-dicarboxylate transport system permease small subunit
MAKLPVSETETSGLPAPSRRPLVRRAASFLQLPVWAAAILQLACTLFLAYGVFARYFGKSSISYLNELVVLLACWVAFLGAAEGIRTHYHVMITLLVARFPLRVQAVIDIVVGVIMTAGLVLLAYLGFKYMVESKAMLEALGVSRRALIASMPVGFSFMALYTAMHVIQTVQALRSHTYEPPRAEPFADDDDADGAAERGGRSAL